MMRLGTSVLVLIVALIILGFLGSELLHMGEDLSDLQAENRQLREEIQQLKDLIGSLSQERDAAIDALAKSIDDINQLTKVIESKDKSIIEAEKRINELENIVEGQYTPPDFQNQDMRNTEPTNSGDTSSERKDFKLVSALFLCAISLSTLGGYNLNAYLQNQRSFKNGKKSRVNMEGREQSRENVNIQSTLVTVQMPRKQLDQYIAWLRASSKSEDKASFHYKNNGNTRERDWYSKEKEGGG